LDDQLSFGTDKKTIKRMLDGIAKARKGEVIVYAPEFYRDRGYVVIGKIRGDRKTEHKGHNIDIRDARKDFYDDNMVDDMDDLKKLDRDLVINPNHKTPLAAESSWKGVAPATSMPANFETVKRSEDTQWSAEPEEPAVEYDAEIEEEELNEGSMVITAIALGGLVVTGALGWVVYRGLSEV
jgi:hypothetical protein